MFKLNDTFGFPLDLNTEIAAEQGIEIDEEGFHAEMTTQKERARAARLKKNISGWSEDLFGALDAERCFACSIKDAQHQTNGNKKCRKRHKKFRLRQKNAH